MSVVRTTHACLCLSAGRLIIKCTIGRRLPPRFTGQARQWHQPECKARLWEGPMRTLLFACLVMLALGAGSVSASDRLSDTQMDQISAGALPSVPSCSAGGACASITSTSTSSVVTYVDATGTLTTASTTTTQVDCVSGCVIVAPIPPPTTSSTPIGTSPGASGGSQAIPTGTVILHGLGVPP